MAQKWQVSQSYLENDWVMQEASPSSQPSELFTGIKQDKSKEGHFKQPPLISASLTTEQMSTESKTLER